MTCLNLRSPRLLRLLIAAHLLNSIRDLKIEVDSSFQEPKIAATQTNFELDLRLQELEREGSYRIMLIAIEFVRDSKEDFLRLIKRRLLD